MEVRLKLFSREETIAELQGCEFSRKRRAFFNDNNEDLRLKQPGVRWQLIKEKRVEVFQDCMCKIKQVFDEVCEKITGERSESTSSPLPVLPNLKTPSVSKFRSTHKKCSTNEAANTENILPTETVGVVNTTDVGHLCSTRQSTRLSQIQSHHESLDNTMTNDSVSPKVTAHSIPARSTRQSTRLQSKVYSAKNSPLKTDLNLIPDLNLYQRSKQHTQPAVLRVESPDLLSKMLPNEERPEVKQLATVVEPDTQTGSNHQSACSVPVRRSVRLSRIQSEHKTGIQKLQEEHRSRNKGKLVSLSELRNASPAFKESAKKIRTRCKPPSENSTTPCIGNKRLRSVSLERLSPDHLQSAANKKTAKLSLSEDSDDPANNITDVYSLKTISQVRVDDHHTEDVKPTSEVSPGQETAGSCSESKQDRASPVKLSEETSDGMNSSQEDKVKPSEEISPSSFADVSHYEGSSDNKSSPENYVSEESSQDEVSPSKFGDESGSADNSSPDDCVVPHTKHDEESNHCETSPIHYDDEDKTRMMSKPSKLRVLNFFVKKGGIADTKNTRKASAAPPLSFLPRNSPQKSETFQSRQEKLTTKVLLKKEEEDRRKDELKMRKQHELQEKIRKREERRKRVAENQAELRKQQAEKKRKLEDLSSRDEQIKKINEMKAKEKEEKNKRLKQRMHAAEVRRKQEEEQQRKRLQQLEDDRRMVTELAHKRKELEEEEKRQKRLEKTKLDKERLLQREAQLLDKEEQKRKQIQEEEKRIAEATKKRARVQPILGKKLAMDPTTKLEKLLESTIPKPTTTTGGVYGVTPTKQDHTQKFLQQWSKMIKGNSRPGYFNSPASSAVNTTFTVTGTPDKNSANTLAIKTPDNYHVLPGSVLSHKIKEKLHGITSYEMTPAENDPLYAYENYDIGDLSSDDSTDDEDAPKKEIPQWAHPETLNKLMEIQENTMAKNAGSVSHIFPPEELLRDPDLAKIFRQKRKRFYNRSSSAQWDSPMYKRY